MDWKRKTDVPIEELHDVALGLHNVSPGRHLLVELGCPVVFLHITDEYQLVINFIEFGRNQEARCQVNANSLGVNLRGALRVEEVPIKQLNCDMDGFCALLEPNAQSVQPRHVVISKIHVKFGGFPGFA
jgi:hypothetical protein